MLAKDSVPTIFPNLPAYLTSVVKKRKAPKDRNMLHSFFKFINDWEAASSSLEFFLSKETALGFRVTIHSILSLLTYLTSRGMEYLFTSKLTQNIFEHFFGLIRQLSGPNANRTPQEFLFSTRLLSVYNLAKLPKYGNCPVGEKGLTVLTTLESLMQKEETDRIENEIDSWLVSDCDTFQNDPWQESFGDHEYDENPEHMKNIVYYLAGYIARKFFKKFSCTDCLSKLTVLSAEAADKLCCPTYLTKKKMNNLKSAFWPSKELYMQISIERCVTRVLKYIPLHAEIVFMSLDEVKDKVPKLPVAHNDILKYLLSFYVTIRLNFFVRMINNITRSRDRQKKYNKLSKLVFAEGILFNIIMR